MKKDQQFAQTLTEHLESPQKLAEFYHTIIDTLTEPPTEAFMTIEHYEKAFLDVVSEAIHSKAAQPIKKFHAMYLLLKATEIPERAGFMASLAKMDELLRDIFHVAQTDLNKTTWNDRGKEYFGRSGDRENKSVGRNYVNICYEALLDWGKRFGVADQKHDLHIYHFLADFLKKKTRVSVEFIFVEKNYNLACNLATWNFKERIPPLMKPKQGIITPERSLTKSDFSRKKTISPFSEDSLGESVEDIDLNFGEMRTKRESRQPGNPTSFLDGLRKTTFPTEDKNSKNKIVNREESPIEVKKENTDVIKKEKMEIQKNIQTKMQEWEADSKKEALVIQQSVLDLSVKEIETSSFPPLEGQRIPEPEKVEVIERPKEKEAEKKMLKLSPKQEKKKSFQVERLTSLRMRTEEDEKQKRPVRNFNGFEKPPRRYHTELLEIERAINRSAQLKSMPISGSMSMTFRSSGARQGSSSKYRERMSAFYSKEAAEFLAGIRRSSIATGSNQSPVTNESERVTFGARLPTDSSEGGNTQSSSMNLRKFSSFGGRSDVPKRNKYDPFLKLPIQNTKA